MAFLTLAALTIKEASRRRSLVGAMLLGLLIFGISMLVTVIDRRLHHLAHIQHWPIQRLIIQEVQTQAVVTALCLSAIKCLGGLFALLLAGGVISSEIERGLLAVILPKPIARWQILLGKWLGLNVVLVGSVLVWTAVVYLSLSRQTHRDLHALLDASIFLALYPLIVSTLALSLSTFAQRLFGTSLALAMVAFAWFDGILNLLGDRFNVDSLHQTADFAGLVVPQGYVGFWVDNAVADVLDVPNTSTAVGRSSDLLVHVGERIHVPHLDAIYVFTYIVCVFLLGVWAFQRRDV